MSSFVTMRAVDILHKVLAADERPFEELVSGDTPFRLVPRTLRLRGLCSGRGAEGRTDPSLCQCRYNKSTRRDGAQEVSKNCTV